MKANLKWLLVPPAVAVVLLMGPLGQTGKDPATPQSGADVALRAHSEHTGQATPEVAKGTGPALPGTLEVFGTLFGVLLLGGSLLFLFSKLRRTSLAHGGTVLTVRQSVRLSNRHSIHAIQYEDRILVLGECGGNLTLLCNANDSDRDAETITQRDQNSDDEGAVPRDLILTPRPRQTLPRTPVGSASNSAKAGGAHNPLNDFRTLLKKVSGAVGGR